jgi:hypothetical protein
MYQREVFLKEGTLKMFPWVSVSYSEVTWLQFLKNGGKGCSGGDTRSHQIKNKLVR